MSAAAPFHALPVTAVEPLCDDAVAVSFAVPPALAEAYRFAPGQWITVRRCIDGREERRSYSVCSRVGGPLRIGVRIVEGGVVSGWLARDIAPGTTVDVQPPSGTFTPDLRAPGLHVLVAAGSGITPILSIASSVLTVPGTRVVLVYANRRGDSVMFLDEVAELKDAHVADVQLIHVLSREQQEIDLFSGRIDAAKFAALLEVIGPVDRADHWWLCGPVDVVRTIGSVLAERGVAPERVHRELFYVEDHAPTLASHDEPDPGGVRLTVVVDGRTTTTVGHRGASVLDAALANRPDLPFACKGGVCGTCRARVVVGDVHMRRNFVLEPAELRAGYVLTCQAIPRSDDVVVDFDA